jgi:tRNA 2-thiouridine synthesizing protein A
MAGAGLAAMEEPTRLDLSGLACPLPVLKANKALRGLAPGALLEIRATDPAALKDFPAFAEETGHHLLSVTGDGAAHLFLLRKRAP